MAIQEIQNGILYAVSGDTKPTNYATNTIWLEQDTGNIFRYSGSSWDLFRGAAKTETLSNKTLDAGDQADVKRMHVADHVREIGALGACPSGAYSSGWLLGLTFLGVSGALQTVDSSHGLSYLYTSTTVANTSQAGQKSANPFTYRAWSPYFRIKCNVISTGTNRYFIGFTNNSTTPTSDTFLSTTDSGVGIGWRDSDTNFTIFNNDGSGTMVTTDTGVTIVADIRSFEIIFDNSIPNIVVKMNGTTYATLTTRIPASSTALQLYFFVETTSTIAKTLQLYNAWYEHKRTVTPL
jgi:hypothetical protein